MAVKHSVGAIANVEVSQKKPFSFSPKLSSQLIFSYGTSIHLQYLQEKLHNESQFKWPQLDIIIRASLTLKK